MSKETDMDENDSLKIKIGQWAQKIHRMIENVLKIEEYCSTLGNNLWQAKLCVIVNYSLHGLVIFLISTATHNLYVIFKKFS